MANEKVPLNPVPKTYIPTSSKSHKVRKGDTLRKIAKKAGITLLELVEYNWKTIIPAEINWYLKNFVGCKKEVDGNYVLDSWATPGAGIIYVPDWSAARIPTMRRKETTVRRESPPVLVVKIPLGSSRYFSIPKNEIGRIYAPAKAGGKLWITTSKGMVNLFYKNGKDLDDTLRDEVLKDKCPLEARFNRLVYSVPEGKHGWYFVMITGASNALVSVSFIQNGEAATRPWNGWYCPTEPNTHPTLYETSINFVFRPLQKYDAKYVTSTRAWEASNHVGTEGWEGHCWGWSLASIAKNTPSSVGGFTKWEIRALYTELADNATYGWMWRIGTPDDPIPTGPLSKTEEWVKKFHDGICKWIGEKKRAMNADLRNDQVGASWSTSATGSKLRIPGVRLLSVGMSQSGIQLEVSWDHSTSTLKLYDGVPINVSKGGAFTLSCSVSKIIVQVTPSLLPKSDRKGYVDLSTEVWNHAIFKYISVFKEVPNEGNEMYIEIRTTITGNCDTPFPPGADSTVKRTYTYRIMYNSMGEATINRQKWVSSHGDLPPSCLGTVEDEASFVWYANCGITKANLDAL